MYMSKEANFFSQLTLSQLQTCRHILMSNFSFGHNVFNLIEQLSYLLWRFFYVFVSNFSKSSAAELLEVGKGLRGQTSALANGSNKFDAKLYCFINV